MKPQYARLQIGVIAGEAAVIHSRVVGELSKVPYAEPTWLSEGYHSPYYTDVLILQSSHGIELTLFYRTTDGFKRSFESSWMK